MKFRLTSSLLHSKHDLELLTLPPSIVTQTTEWHLHWLKFPFLVIILQLIQVRISNEQIGWPIWVWRLEEGKGWRIPMSRFHSAMMTTYYIRKQLRGEKADFSSQFPVIVHCVEKPRQQELRQSHITTTVKCRGNLTHAYLCSAQFLHSYVV